MNKKFLVYSLVGLLSSGAAAGFVLANSKQAQSLPASGNPQQPRSVRVDQHFIEMMIPHHQDAIAMADLALSRAKHPEVKKIAEAIKKEQTLEIEEMRTWYKKWYGKEVPAYSMTDMSMMGNHHKQGQGPGSGMMGQGQGMMSPGQGMMGQGQGMMSPGQGMMSPGQGMMGQGQGMMGQGQGMMGQGQGRMSPGQGMMSMKTDIDALKKAPDFDKEFVRQMIPHHQMAVKMAQMASGRAVRPEIRTLAQSIIKSQNAEIAQMQGWQQAWNQ
ncbi:DUF305 domain-containing protein [Nostoc sp. 'Peltigera membranacea cyanobiont' 210A]|uniref:DUF305 domain-containing protein n=1 Tax=Nostoc sp. 'Peltigera membranacea cyanobiont' 210A TaxID=2014529 RepID=UPI000B951531|nr:DUF305 domain-containing protein [Nostoc sp. 'Peltigera membranacea cyanobiont' 210A]OYD95759.1 DUF305 domain-containing protein [Nostoc sp. 'Peltigera membranacea cyanobiont' 210A]